MVSQRCDKPSDYLRPRASEAIISRWEFLLSKSGVADGNRIFRTSEALFRDISRGRAQKQVKQVALPPPLAS
jgi:hypothetical protein